MEARTGKRVRISFTCRLGNGTVYDLARSSLELVLGEGSLLPTLASGLAGMKPGESRTVRVPAGEVNGFLARERPVRPPQQGRRGGRYGYDIGPGDGGDVLLTIPPPAPEPRELAGDEPVLFEVHLLTVE